MLKIGEAGNFFFLFFQYFGHGVQLVGSEFPSQGLNPDHGSDSAKF